MKKIVFINALLLVLIASLLGPISNVSVAHAQQTCVDATGAPIPCPPTDAPTDPATGGGSDDGSDNDNSGGGQPGGGNPNPPTVSTATATPVPTSTPFPIALPESDYLGSCNSANGNLQDCLDQFTCEDGTLVIKVDIYTGGNGSQYDVYCIPHETLKDLPIAFPPDSGETGNWTGGCWHDVDQCVSDLAASCEEEGGDVSVWYDDEGGAGIHCENQSEASQPAPTEAPAIAAAPTDDGSTEGNEDWDESCSWASCWAVDLACWMDGGSGYGVDDGAGGVVYHCDVPATEGQASPPSPWTPWITVGALAILIGLLLPAVQKVREAAARSKANSHSAKVDLINKDDGGTEASDYLLEIDGIKGESKAHIKKATLTVRKSGGDQQDY